MEKQRKCWDSTGKNGKAWEIIGKLRKHGKTWEKVGKKGKHGEIWENIRKGGRSRENVGRSGNLNDFIL